MGVGGWGGQAGVELVLLVGVARLTLQRLERDRIRISVLEVLVEKNADFVCAKRNYSQLALLA
jgi:hypothetical protein